MWLFVIVALPDGPEWVGAFFGILKLGAVVVMANPQLKPEDVGYFYEYTRARVAIVGPEGLPAYAEAAHGSRHLRRLLVVGGSAPGHAAFDPLSPAGAGGQNY